MSSSPVSNTGSSYVIPVAFASGQANIKPVDSMSLFSFLEHVGTTKNASKQTTFDSQAVDAVVNREYFLGVAQQIQYLSQKYAKVVNYADAIAALTVTFNGRATTLNVRIDDYNNLKNNLNNHISDMNNAINTINGISSPTASDIATYNAAVSTFNSYLNSSGNIGLIIYQGARNLYNLGTSYDNQVTIPAINDLISGLDIGIPQVPQLTPATAPLGSSTYPSQTTYSPGSIPNISPIPPDDLPHVDLLPDAGKKTDIIETYFMPFAEAYLKALAATSKKLAGIDDYRAFVNFILKQGFELNPSLVNAFIMDSANPSTQASSPSANGAIGSMIVGMNTPNLELVLSTALFKIITADAKTPIPPHIYDQINALALSLLAQIGASAGLSVIKLFGDKLKALGPGTASVDVAIAAALLQNILKVVADNGKSTLDALVEIMKGIPGISEGEAKQLAEKLLAAQNISLLLNGAASVGIALKSPSTVKDILTTTFNSPPLSSSSTLPSTNSSSSEAIQAPLYQAPPLSVYNTVQENPYSSTGLNAAINNPPSSYNLTQTLTDRLEQDANIPKPGASTIINQALTNTAARLPNANSSEALFKETLADELLKQNLKQEQANFIAENAAVFINSTRPETPVLTTEELAAKLKGTIQEVVKSDVNNVLPETVVDSLISILTDRNRPNSFISLYENQIKNLEVHNDKKIIDQLVDQRREFEKPHIDSFFIFRKWLDPANNLINSYMTGLMYDKTIPSNWQRPLSIQV